MLWDADVVELGRAECLRLLAGECVGRVVFTEGALPAAWPVDYVLDGEEAVFRTGRTGQLATATPGRVVAFEADSVDRVARSGWSVLGVGEAYEICDRARLVELAERGSEPWTDQADMTVSVPLQLLAGRRLSRDGSADGELPAPGDLGAARRTAIATP
jgi:uncharacterized protein